MANGIGLHDFNGHSGFIEGSVMVRDDLKEIVDNSDSNIGMNLIREAGIGHFYLESGGVCLVGLFCVADCLYL